jgi:hypothetical protein
MTFAEEFIPKSKKEDAELTKPILKCGGSTPL